MFVQLLTLKNGMSHEKGRLNSVFSDNYFSEKGCALLGVAQRAVI
jgi:hypothetical protein